MRKSLIATAVMIALSSGSLYAQTQASSSMPDKSKSRAANAAQAKMNTTSQGVNSTGTTTQIEAPIDQSATTTATQQIGNPGNLGNSQAFSESNTNTTSGRTAAMTSGATTTDSASMGSAPAGKAAKTSGEMTQGDSTTITKPTAEATRTDPADQAGAKPKKAKKSKSAGSAH